MLDAYIANALATVCMTATRHGADHQANTVENVIVKYVNIQEKFK
jgi:hypothetical protein